MEQPKDPQRLYIVTRAHNLDYISATAYLTLATSESEAIIYCMGYKGDLYGDADEEARLRSLSLDDLEQSDRDNGNVWHAELFTMPELKPGDVKRIAELDTD